MSTSLATKYADICARIDAAASDRPVTLVAVSKLQPASAVRELHQLGQQIYGENYVQEALEKMAELSGCAIQWHLIGPLQSNKCREVAEHFDWLQTLDRAKLIPLLARHRPAELAPLNVLIQVNIDDEDSKSGVAPADVPELAAAVTAQPRLRLRGIMSIPKPWPDAAQRSASFARLRQLFEQLRARYPDIDTLSMGMSEDFELALREGATMVRVGSALFGARR
ncbi:MAG TPA: YggS family pyridoxal phosphate-dependent enzyme [Xanthomonadales bacterium]|nr:YggS family pyridoxal phosphate-dependent enzyme [Xanthomonadales bacterium]